MSRHWAWSSSTSTRHQRVTCSARSATCRFPRVHEEHGRCTSRPRRSTAASIKGPSSGAVCARKARAIAGQSIASARYAGSHSSRQVARTCRARATVARRASALCAPRIGSRRAKRLNASEDSGPGPGAWSDLDTHDADAGDDAVEDENADVVSGSECPEAKPRADDEEERETGADQGTSAESSV